MFLAKALVCVLSLFLFTYAATLAMQGKLEMATVLEHVTVVKTYLMAMVYK